LVLLRRSICLLVDNWQCARAIEFTGSRWLSKASLAHAGRIAWWCASPCCATVAISTADANSVWCVSGSVAWLETCARVEFSAAWNVRDRTSRASGVAVNLSRAWPRVPVFFCLVEFGSRTSCEARRAIAVQFWRVLVGTGFLLVTTLAQNPDNDTEERKGKRNADCASDDDAEVGTRTST
jgi:hypothetical protein